MLLALIFLFAFQLSFGMDEAEEREHADELNSITFRSSCQGADRTLHSSGILSEELKNEERRHKEMIAQFARLAQLEGDELTQVRRGWLERFLDFFSNDSHIQFARSNK